MKLSASLLAAASLSTTGFSAPPANDQLRESEQRQEQLGAEAKALVAALDVMLGEYARNGLAGDGAHSAGALRTQLDRLTVAEMRQVVDLLQQARTIQDKGAGVKTVADAHTAQKQVVTIIQRILTEHARQSQAAEIARAIDALADRQARNLQNGIELGRMAGGAKPENFEAVMQAQLETQRGEQAAIAEELQIATERVRKFAADPEHAAVAEKFKLVAQQIERIQPTAADAAESLKSGRLFKAVTDEKVSRDELRKAARAIAPREQGSEALRKAERELAQGIREQEQLAADTAKQTADTDFPKWIEERMTDIDPNRTLEREFRRMTPDQRIASPALRAKFDAEQAVKATQLAKLEDQQGELAAKVDQISADILEIPQSSQALRDAISRLQDARSAMLDADAPAAQVQQKAALEKMHAAHQEVRKKAEEAEILAARSGDKIEDLQRLKDAVENLARQEQAVAAAAQPDRAQQADIARRAEQMAQRAAELVPQAMEAMRQAAASTQRAEQALNEGQQAKAQQAAQQAATQLDQAARQMAQELAKTKDAKQELDRAQALIQDIAKLIEAEQKLSLETAKAAASKVPDDLRKLAQEQAAVEKLTTDFKSKLPGALALVAGSLNDAENAMRLAQAALKDADAPKAAAAEKEALQKLFDTQKLMNGLAQAARQMMGEEFADAGKMAEAANKLAQALQNVEGADKLLEQAAEQMGQQFAQNAAQAAQQAAEAAKQAAEQAGAARQEARQAGNQPAAQQAGDAAREAGQAAQAAQQAAKAAQQMANQPGARAAQAAQQVAEQAGKAAQAAQQAAKAAGQAQKSSQGQPGSQQAGQAQKLAQQAAEAAQTARQMANSAMQAAQAGAQQAGQNMQQAAQQLAQAAMEAAQAGGQLSPGAQQAAQQAAQQLAQAAAQAMNGQNADSQQAAEQAAQALAQAAGMAAAMQAGIGQQGPQGKMPGQGMKGDGQQPGQGQGTGPTKQANNQPSQGADGYKPGSPEAIQRAAREAALKKAAFVGLPAREREAIQQSLGEKYPEEFGALVEQYLLNLANEAAKKK
jgi:hypothetical protein